MRVKIFSTDETRSKSFPGMLQETAEEPEFFIDLDFELTRNDDKILSLAEKNPGSFFMINSVCGTLSGFPRNVTRFNGWNSFIERPVIEAACKDGEAKSRTEEFAKLIGKNVEWVPDIPGLLSARVVAMIINEAYFTLQDKVSSREDIDTAMKLGTNYPYGPFEWSRKIGLKNVLQLLETLSVSNPRYQPAELLKKEALIL